MNGPKTIKYEEGGLLYEFDGPQMFVGRNDQGRAMLAICVEDDEEGRHFLAVPVGARRATAVASSAITLREAFRFPEDGTWWRFSQTAAIHEPMALAPSPKPATSELPSRGARLRPPAKGYHHGPRGGKYAKRQSRKATPKRKNAPCGR